MSKKKLPPANLSRISTQRDQFIPEGVRLSEVRYVALEILHANPANAELFTHETSEYFERLKSDIQKNGVLVPLIAKEDGVLLAGHNRLSVARELQLPRIPVQYVTQRLNEAQENALVINDNLLRRHLTTEQRMMLYRKLYPNFDERISSQKGRRKQPNESLDKESGTNKLDNVQFPKKNLEPLTATQIAHDTGQAVEAVRKQLQRGRQTKQTQKPALAQTKNHSATTAKLTKTQAIAHIKKALAASNISPIVKKEVLHIIQSITSLS